ncbi:MAG: outer membrane lipoprotein carrier protein LolA [Thermodesulfobacteriota bacterium]|nr:outer membrane lipoprotein carrier protein LolA [Thermodesulfobacteriota bacterium]
MTKIWKISLVVLGLLVLPGALVQADTLEDIQKAYLGHDGFTVKFDQDTYQTLVKKKIHFTGMVSYKRGCGVRMDVFTPERQLIIVKGSTLWINLIDQGTSSVQEIPEAFASRNVLSFFAGMNHLSTDYEIEPSGKGLVLHPKKGTGIIHIQVNDKHHITKLELKDATGNISTIHLHGYEFKADPDMDLFDPDIQMNSIDQPSNGS